LALIWSKNELPPVCTLFSVYVQMEGRQDDDTPTGCILLNEDQIDEMMIQLQNRTTDSADHRRQKRTLIPGWPAGKWPLPITYRFDGSHCEYSALNYNSQLYFLNNFTELSKIIRKRATKRFQRSCCCSCCCCSCCYQKASSFRNRSLSNFAYRLVTILSTIAM